MADACATILLASGLSVLEANSFSRQFRLLKKFLEDLCFHVVLAGRMPAGKPASSTSPPEADIFDLPVFSMEAVGKLTRESGVKRIILLGYPDQFPFLLDGTEVPAYFWYQCSKSFIPPGLEATVVVPLTPMTATRLQRAGFMRRAAVIPHGVDSKVFHPAPRRREQCGRHLPGPTILSVGANSRRKRFDKLIEAFSLAVKALPGARLRIKTDREYKPGGFNLIRLAERCGVADRVSIIAQELSAEELAVLYASADIYVHAAEWEGFCIPVIEAMACGLPVVTHPVQGPGELVPYPDLLAGGSELIRDGDFDLLMADPGGFAEAIIRFAQDPVLARHAAETGRSAAVKRFDIRMVAEEWSKLLQSGPPEAISTRTTGRPVG